MSENQAFMLLLSVWQNHTLRAWRREETLAEVAAWTRRAIAEYGIDATVELERTSVTVSYRGQGTFWTERLAIATDRDIAAE